MDRVSSGNEVRLKSLVSCLQESMPKGGLGIDCPWLSVAVLPMAPKAGSCSSVSVIVR